MMSWIDKWGMVLVQVFGGWRGEVQYLLWPNKIDFLPFQINKMLRWPRCGRNMLMTVDGDLLGEEALFANLLADLEGFVFTIVEDKWTWNLEDAEVYSVKSLYDKLEEDGRVEGIHTEMEKYVFGNIWKVGVPSKVTAFVWKALLDRIPTRLNLEIRHCLPPDIGTNCVWCEVGVETTSHIFLHCDLVRNVWMKLMEWLDFNFIMPPNLFIHWECWSGGAWNNRIRKGLRMIWQAAIWVMWKARNNCIFNNEVTRWEEVVHEIKVVSWRWLLGRFQGPTCLFYEWEWDPRQCLLR